MAPIRRFNRDNGEDLRLAVGSCDIQGARSELWLVRISGTGEMCICGGHTSGGSGIGWSMLTVYDSRSMYMWNGVADSSTGGGVHTLNEFALIGYSRSSGSNTGKWHIYNFASPGWSHTNGTASIGDASSIAGGTLRIGSWEDAYYLTADVAAGAIWDSNLSDGAYEDLGPGSVDSLEEWLDSSPAGMWFFDQESPATEVVDLTGNGADQVSISGTSVVDADLPIPYYAEPTEGGGKISYFDGDSWVDKPVHYFNGESWLPVSEISI